MPYPSDPSHDSLRSEVLDLYDTAWPAVSAKILRARELGGDWYEVSTPVVIREQQQLIAHVGIIEVQLLLAGQRKSVAAVHAVCVHPAFRGQGYGRRVMEMALDQVDAAGHRTTILWSEKTDFYKRFGFDRVQEPVFHATIAGSKGSEDSGERARLLDLANLEDRQHLRSLLANRRPVSDLAAAADEGWHFLVDLALWPAAESMLTWLPRERVIAVAEVLEETLHLYDVIGQTMPSLRQIAAAVADTKGLAVPESATVYFTPDRLQAPLEPIPHPFEDWLHVRGEPLLPRELSDRGPWALSPLTRT